MSANLYDKAIVNKFRELMANSDIYITPPENVFRTIALLNKDEIRLPLISLQRQGYTILNGAHSMRFSGASVDYDEPGDTLISVQAIPIRINYSLDVWTRHLEECDDIVRELIWYLSTHPTMEVEIPYGLDMKHHFNIMLDEDVEDNSDILEHTNRGEYFRQTISFYVDDAYLWKSKKGYPARIGSISYEAYSMGEFIEREVVVTEEETDENAGS